MVSQDYRNNGSVAAYTSGTYGFAAMESYRSSNHQIDSKKKARKCLDRTALGHEKR